MIALLEVFETTIRMLETHEDDVRLQNGFQIWNQRVEKRPPASFGGPKLRNGKVGILASDIVKFSMC